MMGELVGVTKHLQGDCYYKGWFHIDYTMEVVLSTTASGIRAFRSAESSLSIRRRLHWTSNWS